RSNHPCASAELVDEFGHSRRFVRSESNDQDLAPNETSEIGIWEQALIAASTSRPKVHPEKNGAVRSSPNFGTKKRNGPVQSKLWYEKT
ncbi:hypothetical protein, partial [Blastopirellula marina]|uniref:hypothetical protein n=1 Tax=Blastopirellula marina TaxID=124 RepID=UPI001F1DF49B